ncbi:sirohydrochlorin cobaltochelatase [Deltaproteobacteria bacterium Smac51]|nr:sirohydrochlorin cobaltochelatase [Deltaproteobacteria bacterium Smac51]
MSETSPILWLILAAFAAVMILPSTALAYDREPQKPAIVLAAFGTTDVDALQAILNVENKVKAAFPGYDVHVAFTSNIIRKIWHERANDQKFIKANKIPKEIYNIGNPLTTLALIQENGSRDILVQSLHVTNGSEFDDLNKIVTQLSKIDAFQESKRPFPYLALGSSALGQASKAELERAAGALAPLAAEAKAAGGALLLMGHGNEHLDVKSYRQFEKAMNDMYEAPVFVGLVEGSPELDDVMEGLKKTGVKNVTLAPLMLVAGDHAKNDMAGDEEDSWASILKNAGYEVKIHLQGLGLNDSWADIYIERLRSLESEHVKAARK